MPIRQRLAGGPKAIGAGRRQPVEPVQILPVELHAVSDELHPVLVIHAAACAPIKKLARNIRRVQQPRFLILKLVNAAAAAAVAKGLPLAAIESCKRFFPKWRAAVHDKSSLALLSAGNQAGISRHKVVKKIAFAFFIATALNAAPVAAQSLTAAGYDFVDAVKNSNGDKAIQVLSTHPPGIINTKDGEGNTGLIIAISRSDEQWTGFLLNKGADPNLAGKSGDTPLIAAARVSFEPAVEWLVGLGAKIDVSNRMGETPLIVAVQQRNPQIVRLLLNQGANPDKTDSAAGYSARDYAQRDPRARDILKLIEDKKPKAAAAAAK